MSASKRLSKIKPVFLQKTQKRHFHFFPMFLTVLRSFVMYIKGDEGQEVKEKYGKSNSKIGHQDCISKMHALIRCTFLTFTFSHNRPKIAFLYAFRNS